MKGLFAIHRKNYSEFFTFIISKDCVTGQNRFSYFSNDKAKGLRARGHIYFRRTVTAKTICRHFLYGLIADEIEPSQVYFSIEPKIV